MQPRRYLIPRLENISIVVLSYGVMRLTVKQFTIVLLYGIAAINLWSALASSFPLWLLIVCVSFLALVILPFGWITIAQQPLEHWLLVLLRYWLLPRCYLWEEPPTPATTRRREEKRAK